MTNSTERFDILKISFLKLFRVVLIFEAQRAKEQSRTTHFLSNYYLAAACLLSTIHQWTLHS